MLLSMEIRPGPLPLITLPIFIEIDLSVCLCNSLCKMLVLQKELAVPTNKDGTAKEEIEQVIFDCFMYECWKKNMKEGTARF